MSEIDDIWPQIIEAFGHYGKKLRASPGPERRKLLQKRIDDGYSADELIAAVHGYLWLHGGFDRDFGDGTTSGDYFRPETVFKATGMDDRVERGWRPWEAPRAKNVPVSDWRQEALRKQAEDDRRLRVVRGE